MIPVINDRNDAKNYIVLEFRRALLSDRARDGDEESANCGGQESVDYSTTPFLEILFCLGFARFSC